MDVHGLRSNAEQGVKLPVEAHSAISGKPHSVRPVRKVCDHTTGKRGCGRVHDPFVQPFGKGTCGHLRMEPARRPECSTKGHSHMIEQIPGLIAAGLRPILVHVYDVLASSTL